MKLTVLKENLLQGLQQVQNVVTTRTTLPILSNVMMETVNGRLQMTTTDLEVSVRANVEAEIERPGATTLPARRLFNIVRELPPSPISIEVDSKNFAAIRCGTAYFRIYGLPQEDFPALPDFSNARVFTLTQKQLRDGLRKTSYAISTDETRYVLNGILFALKDNKITLVATDGRRLALVDIESEFPKSDEGDFIVPSKAVSELQRLISEEGNIRISVTGNQVCFDLAGTLLISKLIDGNYPNFRQVIPSDTKECIELDREPLLNAVHRVALLTSDKSRSIKFTFAKNELEIAANTPEVGEAHESLPIKYSGSELSIAFDPEFFMAPLRNLPNDTVLLHLTDEVSPGVMKVKAPFLYVIMPMRMH